MGIKTRSKFFYGYEVTAENDLIAIDEGAGRVDALLTKGKYSLTEYIDMINSVLNDRFTNTYQVTVDRNTRIISISVSASVTLLIGDLSGGNTAYDLMGFTGSNQANTSFLADQVTGSEFIPQFWLQDYIDAEDDKEFQDATVNESANGNVEIVSFGLKSYVSFTLDWINNYTFVKGAPIETNETGVEDARKFLDWCIEKGKVEFMRDRDNPASFLNLLLEKTPTNSKGVGYRLREKRPLQGFYTTGQLKYRTI